MRGLAYRGALRQLAAPGLHLGQAIEEAKVMDVVKHLEVAKRGAKHGIHQAEAVASKVGAGAQHVLLLLQALPNLLHLRR